MMLIAIWILCRIVIIYNSLKKKFKYTYKKGITGDIMNGVAKPGIKKRMQK